jgi:hypothetical protein
MNQTTAARSNISEARSDLKRRLGIVLTLIALTSIATLPFFVIGEDQKVGCCGGEMPVTHDSWMHFNQMRAFWRGLSSGVIYPRWDDETHSGYGAPTTSFYPPGAYYATSAVYFLTRDWRWVWVGFYWLAGLGSAAAIYWYARQTLARGASIVATAVYVFAPYHLINQYQRGAMAEFLSFVWAPLMLLFAWKLLNDAAQKLMYVAGLAASFGAFLWTHPPTAYQLLLVFGSCFAAWAVERREWSGLVAIGFALALGSMLAAAYFYPAILEQHLINSEDVERTWPYHDSYVYDYSQTRYDRTINPFFARIDRIWAFTAVAILMAAVALLAAGLRSASVWLWASAGLSACFLMTRFSAPIGRLIPKIEIGIFSWRMLTISSLSAALLAGACAQAAIDAPVERRKLRLIWCGSIAALIVIGAVAMSAWQVAWPMWRGQSFEPNPEHYNYATLPRGVPRDVRRMDLAQLASGNGRIVIERWMPDFRGVIVESERQDQLQLRTSNFAGWTALVDGRKVEIKEATAKNIAIDLPAGRHRVTLEFRSTPIRHVSNWITVLSFALLFSILVLAKRRK